MTQLWQSLNMFNSSKSLIECHFDDDNDNCKVRWILFMCPICVFNKDLLVTRCRQQRALTNIFKFKRVLNVAKKPRLFSRHAHTIILKVLLIVMIHDASCQLRIIRAAHRGYKCSRPWFDISVIVCGSLWIAKYASFFALSILDNSTLKLFSLLTVLNFRLFALNHEPYFRMQMNCDSLPTLPRVRARSLTYAHDDVVC